MERKLDFAPRAIGLKIKWEIVIIIRHRKVAVQGHRVKNMRAGTWQRYHLWSHDERKGHQQGQLHRFRNDSPSRLLHFKQRHFERKSTNEQSGRLLEMAACRVIVKTLKTLRALCSHARAAWNAALVLSHGHKRRLWRKAVHEERGDILVGSMGNWQMNHTYLKADFTVQLFVAQTGCYSHPTNDLATFSPTEAPPLRSRRMKTSTLLLLALNATLLPSLTYGIWCYLDATDVQPNYQPGRHWCKSDYCTLLIEGNKKVHRCGDKKFCGKAKYEELLLPNGRRQVLGCCTENMCNITEETLQESVNSGAILPVVILAPLLTAFMQFFL
uniref:Activin_recp domain-containing protein n=1 Tax=Steinernema glaseri TaxID=37863 RepID=A0A1I7YJL4_9BILA